MIKIENKVILLLCKENSTYAMYFLARKLILQNNKIDFFFVNHFETFLNKSDINRFTYFKVKEDFRFSAVFDLNLVVNEFIEAIESKRKPDLEYIKYLEDTFTHFKSLQCQLLSTQLFTSHLHDRFYYKTVPMDSQILWLELLYKYIIDFFENNRFDYLFDIDIAELPRSIIVEVAKHFNIEYFSIEHSRYKNYKLPTLSTKWWNPQFDFFLKSFKKISKIAQNDFDEYYKYILSNDLLGPEYKAQPAFKINKRSVYLKFKDFVNVVFYTIKSDIFAGNYLIKRKCRVLFHESAPFVYFYFLSFYRRLYLLYLSRVFVTQDKECNYFYMPLHLIPESSTFNLAPYYTNEMYIIEQVSKSLPLNHFLYVKEHPSMLGERNLSFYRKIKQFHNVVLVSPKTSSDQKSIIMNSHGVITITGTTAFEAALLGKGSLIFGNVPFDNIEGIFKIKNFEDISNKLLLLKKIDNYYSLLNYINTVIHFGTEVNVSIILQRSEKNIKNNLLEDDVLDSEIVKLLSFFTKSILLSNSSILNEN